MGWIRDLNWSKKAGLAVLLAAGLTVGGLVVFDGGSGGGPGTQVLGAKVSVPPTPTITSGPLDGSTTSATTATFTYANTQNGVGFQCKLDNAAFSACAKSGVTYSGLSVGAHTFQVAAQQGNGPLSAPASRSWSVTAPAGAPTITVHPDNPTPDRDATFGFTGTGTFECKLDGAAFVACTSPKIYNDLAVAGHVFQVRTVNGDVTSAPVSFSWTIITSSFGISGSITGVLLAPGAPPQPLNLVFTNPYNNSGGINILGVTITVQHATTKDGAPNGDCDGPENLTVTDGSPTPWPLNVPRRSTKSLDERGIDPTQWPQVQMLNLATNQDACKDTTFTFTYTGTATNS